jgi:NADPH:quinone reductase-like Zn-dependent oxidoreductase
VRAAVYERYGPPEVVRLAEVPAPEPRRGQVLVRVRSAAVTSGDARIRAARFPDGFAPFARLAFGVRAPRRRILGSTFSGEVAAIGAGVEGFAVDDEVCGMTAVAMGAHAELVAVKAAKLAPKPPAVRHDDAAGLLFGGTTAHHFLGKATIGPGTTVLVNGAAGAVGTNVVQLAARLGAVVTGVTRAANAELVTGLGAARTIDHTEVDVLDLDERYDVVLDAVGNLGRAGRRLLAPGGVLLLAVAGLGDTLRARGDVVAGTAPARREVVEQLLGLVGAGELAVVLDRTLDLDGIVEAHRLVDSGRKVGNVVVRP